MHDRIDKLFRDNMAVTRAAAERLPSVIAGAGEAMAASLKTGGKIMTCGNGGSAADAQHFAAELVNRFEIERRELAGLALTTDSSALTAIANDFAYEQVFAKQVRALGGSGDVLLAISTSGDSTNVAAAVAAAHDRSIQAIALTGRDGGRIGAALHSDDIEIRVPADNTARIQEVHTLVLHCLCDLIDAWLFGEQKTDDRGRRTERN
jgi:D-sedoheptulose 7-phosphate isomerase